MITAKLALEDGTVFEGASAGAVGETVGEVVFNTSLTGYQEVFTDPSYHGQIVVMTNPLIGNYGTNEEDQESHRAYVEGVVLRELSRTRSNFRSSDGLGEFLQRNGVVGISGVDTRALTRLLRVEGSMKGVISSVDLDDSSLVEKARRWEGLIGRDMVAPVTSKEIHVWRKGFDSHFSFTGFRRRAKGERVVAMDFGIKHNILRILAGVGFEVVVVPAATTAAEIRSLEPRGIFLSNGPGDPEGVPYAIETIRSLIGEYPTFGICLGHQLIGLSLGGKTRKLRFGHHGGNHPVKNVFTGKVYISVQNHCFVVDPETVGPEVEVSFVNLNDGSLEGIVHRELPLFSVQFHPEASPGPNDFAFLFETFVNLVETACPVSWAKESD